MIAVAVFAGQGWYAMQIYDDKKRFIYYNLVFLACNIFGCGITICGNDSIWSNIMLAVMTILVIVFMFLVFVKKKHYGDK
jgi:hypothetical protein